MPDYQKPGLGMKICYQPQTLPGSCLRITLDRLHLSGDARLHPRRSTDTTSEGLQARISTI
ncbi:hypothetical protein SynPROS71_02308 [Synechococcus sp. PROS-7-1]|nr:hypothetical protein SynPROS71_02308 [Synechococcus sp. PROS-7-1]